MTKLTMVHPHTREHYSVIKRDKLLLCATTWMNVQRVTLSENSQSQTVLYCIIPFIWHSWNDKNLKEFQESWASLVAQRVKRLPAMWETWVRSLGQEDPLEEDMATPLQYSCLENSMDGGACGLYIYIVQGVTESRTWLSDFTWNDKIMEMENRWVVVRG